MTTHLPTGEHDRRNRPVDVLSKLKVFRFEYVSHVPESYCDANEIHRTGTYVQCYDQLTIMAPSRALADAAFIERLKYAKSVNIIAVLESQIDIAISQVNG